MTKFKIGDIVSCPEHYLKAATITDVHIVDKDRTPNPHYKLNSNRGWFSECKLEAV